MLWGHRSTWGHRGQTLIFTKKCIISSMLRTLSMKLLHMHQVDPSSKLIGSNFDLGSQGSKGFFHQKCGDLVHPPNLTRALGKGRMSSSFFLSFFLTMIASSSTCLIGCLPNFVRSMYGWISTKLMGLKIHPGSYGVTGVKNVNHVKNMKTAPIQNLIMSSCRQ